MLEDNGGAEAAFVWVVKEGLIGVAFELRPELRSQLREDLGEVL